MKHQHFSKCILFFFIVLAVNINVIKMFRVAGSRKMQARNRSEKIYIYTKPLIECMRYHSEYLGIDVRNVLK
jgi:hypothetical protein